MLRKQALIAVTALGLTMGSGAALAAPVGLQGVPSNALIGERGATVEPVHYRSRRHYHARGHFVHPRRHVLRRHHYVHPRRHALRRHHFVHPHVVVRRHHYGYPYYYRTRPRVSFGLSFGW